MKHSSSYVKQLTLGVVAVVACAAAFAQNTTAAKKPIVVGFAQIGAESDWRKANTKSMKDEAAARGITLNFSDAQGDQQKEITAMRAFITQGVDAIVLCPIVETGWEPVLQEAKKAKIPVIVEDRTVKVSDPTLFAAFVGSDFKKEGQMAADWLIKQSGGKGKILEIQGQPGSAAANDRHSSFVEALKAAPGLTIIDSQSGDFDLAKGKQVMEAFLKKYKPGDFSIVYAHNDDMALGAVQAIEEAGLKPGKDITIVSVDGGKKAVQAIVDGKINCVVECNPMHGPPVYDTVLKVLAGQPVQKSAFDTDHLFDSTNAAEAVKTRPY